MAILTGLRRGEITGLRWSDVDLSKRKIVVRRNRVSVRGKVVEQQTTKTRAGLRTVALSDFAVAALLAWQLRQAQEAEAAAESLADPWARLHDGRRPSPRSELCDAAVSRGSVKVRVRSYPRSASTA